MGHSIFISPEGARTLADLRISSDLPEPVGEPSVQQLARVPSDECGCPEEPWRVEGMVVLMHFEADGSSEAFLFAGDFEIERVFQARDMADLRAHVFRWIADLEEETSHG